jgi:hypothetical protein
MSRLAYNQLACSACVASLPYEKYRNGENGIKIINENGGGVENGASRQRRAK